MDKDAEIDRLRFLLGPYKDSRELSGMSWSGFNLFGDDKSIRELKRLHNRSSQLEVYTAAYDERIKAAEAEVGRLKTALVNARTDFVQFNTFRRRNETGTQGDD